jgi:pimeloyl-ACP methyl ester carboxylesterase
VMRRPGALHAALNYYRENLAMSPAPPAPVSDSVRERSGGRISVPTLYLVGAEDGCIGPVVSEGVEKHFTGPFEKWVVARAGHFLHQDAAPRRSTGSCSSFSARRDEQHCQRPPVRCLTGGVPRHGRNVPTARGRRR